MLAFATERGRGVFAKTLEVALWCVALLSGAYLLTHALQADAAQRVAQTITPRQTGAQMEAHSGAQNGTQSGDAIIGRLEIAKLNLSVPVVANYDPASLVRGVGHVPGTAVPGGLGNFVVAGHRDTFFRPLRNIKAGMKIRIVTTEGAWSYAVDRTEIVTPAAVNVLDIGNVPELTLITCYPFDFIGAAPNRFIVHAHLLSVDAN